ncbi:MAG: glycoside hydrolase N-terminal domain-containing protein [Alloprevotella sp.]|nr:glycoside hydrolase N-terminal domain-containing protein [Alloprevotella sp.]
MRKLLSLWLMLVAFITAGAEPATPTFSTEDGEATWYYIRFKSHFDFYLTDVGANENVLLKGYDVALADGQQWKVVGESTTSFKLVSKAGRTLVYNTGTQRYVASTTGMQTYGMHQYPNFWEAFRTEVGDVDGGTCLTISGGAAYGNPFTERAKNNDLNKFIFVPVATVVADYATYRSKLPTLSDEEEPIYYYLALTNGTKEYLQDNGASAKVGLDSSEPYNDKARQWQFIAVGDGGDFVIRSRQGRYITSFSDSDDGGKSGSQNNGRYYLGSASATQADAIVFRFGVGATTSDFEIYRKGDSNYWGFNKRGGEVGVWNAHDSGNKMAASDAASLDEAYNAYIGKLPKFSDETNEYWYFVKMTGRSKYFKGASTDTKLELDATVANEDQFKWKFIGTKDNFTMVSKAGKYVYEMDASNTDGGRFQLGTDAASAETFYFDPCGDYVEIVRVGDNSKYGMNDRSVNNPSGVGIWNNNDKGNRLQLFAAESMFAPEPTLYASASELNDESLYYYIQFKTGGAVVEDKGAGTNAKTATMANSNAQRWAFIGTDIRSLKAISKTGRYLSYSDSRYKTTDSESGAVTFELRQSSAHPGYFELVNSGASQAMNQVGGTGAGKDLGIWNIGDPNNPFRVVLPPAPVEPAFYADATPADGDEWYYIQFCKNSLNWIAPTTVGGEVTVTASTQYKEEMMWRFIGNKNSFKLVNKKGEFAYFDGTGTNGRLKTAASDGNTDAYKFSLVVSKGSYAQAWEIKPTVVTDTNNPHLNMYSGATAGNPISVYMAGDGGNPMKFLPVSGISFADYTVASIASFTPENKLTLWYNEPATTARLYSGGQGYSNWMEWSLPIGNGQLGASLFGGVMRDEIQINEKTLWSGRSSDVSANYGQYENFGSVFVENLSDDLTLRPDEGATDYVRGLNLTNATGFVQFKSAKSATSYERQYFASYPDNVVVAHYTSTGTAPLNLRFTLQSGNVLGRSTFYNDASGFFSGNTFNGETQTIKYALRFKVVNLDNEGTVTTTEEGVTVSGTRNVMVVIAGATDFDPYSTTYTSGTAQLTTNLRNRVNTAAAKSYSDLYSSHLNDFQNYWNRMSLDLNGTTNTVPTNVLIDTYNSGNGANALMLEQLYFAYGRYLEISSSRGVDLPNNLQGIWSNMDNPAWNSDIHSNINVQMNYWPAEQTNLSEMHLPFLNYIINMANSPQWKAYATAASQQRGWTCYTENNIFGGCGSFMHNYVISNAWYCTHLWQHYRYTLDVDYLKRAFPAMLSATQFWLDRLVPDTDGTYVCPNEYSPEHGPGSENGVAHAQQLVYDLFSNTLEAIRVLGQAEAGITDDDYADLKNKFNKLDKGLATEVYDGTWGTDETVKERNGVASNTTILREWKYSPYDAGQDGHRHMSHLMCLYPFSQVTPGTDLYTAAVNSLRLRGDGATGWSMGWKINLWARAKDGDHSRTILNNALRHANGGAGVFYNLFDSHAPFQIDGNFGACAGMAEMIMQSQSDTIEILPALPTAWHNGTMQGLKAVGNFTVSINWQNNAATTVTIVSHKGQPLMVKGKDIAQARFTKNGEVVGVAILSTDVVRLQTAENDVIAIDFTQTSTQPEKGVMEILTAEGYGTFYSDRAIVMPQGVTGATVENVSIEDGETVGTLVPAWTYTSGTTVPARTALLIKGDKGNYEFAYSGSTDVFSGSQYLYGQMEDGLIASPADSRYYKLTYSYENGEKVLGFFYGAADGAPFVTKAGKAYLACPTVSLSQARGFRIDLNGEVTGVDQTAVADKETPVVYTIDGRRVNRAAGRLSRGLYIVGGRKVLVP